MENQNIDRFFALFCTERTRTPSRPPSSQSQRNPYQIDFDRILFSSAFRRLQDKTQVFPFPQRSGIHNRLTHSLEVASIGRSLATTVTFLCFSHFKKQLSDHNLLFLWMLPDVISAASLAHDIGNPAFGHAGEDAIRSFFRHFLTSTDLQFSEAQCNDLFYFEGNANAIRLLTRHFPGKAQGGFGLTYTTLASLIKYPWESIAISSNSSNPKLPSKFGFFQSEKNLIQKIFSAHSLEPLVQTPYLCFPRHPFVYLVEAADDISYLLIDLEDAFKLQIISYQEAIEIFSAIFKCFEKDFTPYPGVTDQNEQLAIARSQCLGKLIENLGKTFFEYFLIENHTFEVPEKNTHQTLNPPLSLVQIYQQVNPQFRTVWDQLKQFSVERIYTHEAVIRLQLTGYEVLHGILQRFIPALLTPPQNRTSKEKQLCSLIPPQFRVAEDPQPSPYETIMAFLDFLSGMTDAYALRLYRHLTGIELPAL